MSGQVWKFALPHPGSDEPFVSMPEGSVPVHVGEQGGSGFLWALVPDDSSTFARRWIAVYGTGWSIDGSPDYLGTFVIAGLVWHVFDGGLCEQHGVDA